MGDLGEPKAIIKPEGFTQHRDKVQQTHGAAGMEGGEGGNALLRGRASR